MIDSMYSLVSFQLKIKNISMIIIITLPPIIYWGIFVGLFY